MKELENMEGTWVLWDVLLKQAQANLAQARANEETSRAMHLLTQRMPSQGAIVMVPDRLESWYAAECDAEAGVSIAGKIVKQTEGVIDPRTGEKRGEGLQLLHKYRHGNEETSAFRFRIARGWRK